MKKIFNQYKKILVILTVLAIANIGVSYALTPTAAKTTASSPSKTAVKQKTVVNGINVDPVKVVNNPAFYLNKNITFEANFVAYTSLGLDYNPALRPSNDYIGILIQRTDVVDHVIPLSEMKIFLKRTEAEKHVDLGQGDKIKITGTVFSTALGDPWVDVKTFTVLQEKSKKE